MGEKSLHVRISGKVQGVFYRVWTKGTADDLGLSGWVKNNRDGSVEAVFSGDADNVEQMLNLCLSGPPEAEVSNIEILAESVSCESGFEIQH